MDLTKFNDYTELVAELDEMFDFNGELKGSNKEWMVVYTDNEGDMMLVGDDPWKWVTVEYLPRLLGRSMEAKILISLICLDREFCDMVNKIFIYTREEVQRMNPGALNSRSEDSPATSVERSSAAKEMHGCLSASSLNSENC